MASTMPPQLASLEKEVRDIFKLLSTGFQRLDKTKDMARQSKLLEELTAKMREAKRMIKEFDREIKEDEGRAPPETTKLLNEKKQSLIKELNSYVALRKTYTSSFGNKQELLDGSSTAEPARDMDVRVASTMPNQEVVVVGKNQMDGKDHETIKMPKKVVEDTINSGAETSTTLKGQTEQLGRPNNEMESRKFSLRKASKLVKDTGRQLVTDKCILFFLFLIVVGIIAFIVVKLVHPDNKDIVVPTPPAARRLLMKSLPDLI